MKKEKKSALQEEDKFMLRLPEGMRQQFAEIAKQNDRSLNMELVHRLKASLTVPQDVIEACAEMGSVKDRLDFAVRLFQRAGFNVAIPEKKD
jgi:hypothetical protein